MNQPRSSKRISSSNWWHYSSRFLTLPFLPYLYFNPNKESHQAWREKVALCIIIAFFSSLVGFLTFGLKLLLCPKDLLDSSFPLFNINGVAIQYPNVVISGSLYDYSLISAALAQNSIVLTPDWIGQDITRLFKLESDHCSIYRTSSQSCSISKNSLSLKPISCPDINLVSSINPLGRLYLNWDEIYSRSSQFLVFSNSVIDLASYSASDVIFSNNTRSLLSKWSGKDATLPLISNTESLLVAKCLEQSFTAGFVGTQTVGCVANQVIIIFCLTVVLGVLSIRYINLM